MNALFGLMPSLTAGMRREPLIAVAGTSALKADPEEERQRKLKLIMAEYDRIPEVWRVSAANVLSAAGSLAWDYAETVCTECISLRLPFKKEVRVLRELKLRYDRPTIMFFSKDQRDKAEIWGLGVEEACQDHLRAVNMLALNTARKHGLRDRETLVSAVFQCVTVTISIMAYSHFVDKTIREVFGVPTPTDHMLLPFELEQLNAYLSKFVPREIFDEMHPHIRTAARNMTGMLMNAEQLSMDEVGRIRFRKWTPAEEAFVLRAKGRWDPAKACRYVCRTESAFIKKQKELTKQHRQK